jgi:hypothetical protein
VGADGALLGEHHRVRAVEDRVGDVGHLRARRARRGDHRVEHLRGGDRGPREGAGQGEDLLLDDRHLLDAHLDPEVAAGDHHAVRGAHDLLGAGHGLRLLDLGDERQPGVLADVLDLLGLAHEREGDHVDADLLADLQVGEVLLGHGRQRRRLTRDVEPLRDATEPPISTWASSSPSPVRLATTRMRTAPSAR